VTVETEVHQENTQLIKEGQRKEEGGGKAAHPLFGGGRKL
jgi:hypothetical protein